MANAVSDNNGFIEIKNNKLSKPGVFPYLGKEIGAPEPEKVYFVYRPREELSSQACIDSFKLQPWVIEHKMLGKKYDTKAEDKGIHGVIGEDVYFDESDGWLKGNIKIFSDKLEGTIADGKDELSLGFSCVYEFGDGENNGERYNVTQRRIRGNHLASVEKSRMNVAVMDHATDHMTVTLNHTGDEFMDGQTVDKDKQAQAKGTGKDSITLSALADQIKTLTSVVTGIAEDQKMVKDNYMNDKKKAEDEEEEKKNKSMDDEHDKKAKDNYMDKEKKAKDEDKEKKNGMDEAIKSAIDAAVAPLVDKINTLQKAQSGMDSASLMKEFTERDQLVAKLTPHIGTFDHSMKTLQQVAEYGVEKLGVPTTEGQEIAALNAYLHNRPASRPLFAVAAGQDGVTASPVDGYLAGDKK